MLVGDPIIGMNLSSSQMRLVQSWGLGHSNHLLEHLQLWKAKDEFNIKMETYSVAPLF